MRLTLVVLLWDTVEEEERQRVGEPERLGEVVAEEDTLTDTLPEAQLVELTVALGEVDSELLAQPVPVGVTEGEEDCDWHVVAERVAQGEGELD